jgi:NADH-quinone oxidoreductase subunit N
MSEHILESISYFKPEIALTITLCVAIIADLLLKRKNQYVSVVVLAGLAVTTVLVFRQIGTNVSIFSDMIAVDPFAVFFKVVLLVSAFFIVVFSVQSRELDQNKFRIGEYYMLITAMVLGMFIMAGAANLLLMYLALELTSISSYILGGLYKACQRFRGSIAEIRNLRCRVVGYAYLRRIDTLRVDRCNRYLRDKRSVTGRDA